MSPTQNDIELIDQYLNGTLTQEGRIQVEQRMEQDSKFAEQVAQLTVVNELIVDMGLLQLKQKIQMGNYDQRSNGGLKTYSLIGIAVLLTGMGIYFSSQPSGQQTLVSKKDTALVRPKEVYFNSKASQTDHHTTTVTQSMVTHNEETTIQNKVHEVERKEMNPALDIPAPQEIALETKTQEVLKKSTEIPALPKQVPIKSKELDSSNTALNVSIEHDHEPDASPQEYLFNPSLGQLWVMPLEKEQNAEVVILDKTGAILYKVQVQEGQPNTWDGRSTMGTEVNMGSYAFVITFKSGKMLQGFITVQR